MAEAQRGAWSHCNCGRQGDDAVESCEHTERGRCETNRYAGKHGPTRYLEVKRWKSEECPVTDNHRLPERIAAGGAKQRSNEHNDGDELEIMQGQRRVGKSERLER